MGGARMAVHMDKSIDHDIKIKAWGSKQGGCKREEKSADVWFLSLFLLMDRGHAHLHTRLSPLIHLDVTGAAKGRKRIHAVSAL